MILCDCRAGAFASRTPVNWGSQRSTQTAAVSGDLLARHSFAVRWRAQSRSVVNKNVRLGRTDLKIGRATSCYGVKRRSQAYPEFQEDMLGTIEARRR